MLCCRQHKRRTDTDPAEQDRGSSQICRCWDNHISLCWKPSAGRGRSRIPDLSFQQCRKYHSSNRQIGQYKVPVCLFCIWRAAEGKLRRSPFPVQWAIWCAE